MLRGHLQFATDVMRRQLFEVLGRRTSQVHTHSAGDQHFLDTWQGPRFTHQLNHRLMVDAQQFADLGMHATLSAAYRFDIRTRAVHLVHVGCRATDVADYTFEVRRLGHLLDLIQHRFFAAGLNDASLVGCD